MLSFVTESEGNMWKNFKKVGIEESLYNLDHGVIKYTDTKAFVGFLKNCPAGTLSGINLPSCRRILSAQFS
jgi:hypothetical protein